MENEVVVATPTQIISVAQNRSNIKTNTIKENQIVARIIPQKKVNASEMNNNGSSAKTNLQQNVLLSNPSNKGENICKKMCTTQLITVEPPESLNESLKQHNIIFITGTNDNTIAAEEQNIFPILSSTESQDNGNTICIEPINDYSNPFNEENNLFSHESEKIVQHQTSTTNYNMTEQLLQINVNETDSNYAMEQSTTHQVVNANTEVLVDSNTVSPTVNRSENVLQSSVVAGVKNSFVKASLLKQLLFAKTDSSDVSSVSQSETNSFDKMFENSLKKQVDVVLLDNTSNMASETIINPPQETIADSSNDQGPVIAVVSSDITTIDHMRLELTRMSASFIDEVSSQFLGVLKCDKCNYNTRHLAAIENHILVHFSQPTKNETYLCIVCHKLLSGLYNFIDHMRVSHNYLFYKHFYWCVRCTNILNDLRQIQFHECQKKNVTVKMFKSNGVVFCMLCKFESEDISEARQHIKLCAMKSANLEPIEVIEIDDD